MSTTNRIPLFPEVETVSLNNTSWLLYFCTHPWGTQCVYTKLSLTQTLPQFLPHQHHVCIQMSIFVIMGKFWSMGFVPPVITHNKVTANMRSAASVHTQHINTHTLGGSQQSVHFLPPVKAHLSQLPFWREQEGKKECASLRFPVSLSTFPANLFI